RPPGSPPTYVHPGASLPIYGQLDVGRDDCVVFVQSADVEAKALGVVGPGRHTLHASKLPFLEGVPEASPGRLEISVVFVRLVPVENAKFFSGLPIEATLDGALSVLVVDPAAYVEDRLQNPQKPLLACAGVAASIDAVFVDAGGVRSEVYAGTRMRERAEPRSVAPPPKGEELVCAACGMHGESGTFCEGCGALLGTRRCVTCRAQLEEGARFCLSCGARV
ncbi:MAG: hypothetical protein ACXVEE_19215, partial [Polyangiales bacterium]